MAISIYKNTRKQAGEHFQITLSILNALTQMYVVIVVVHNCVYHSLYWSHESNMYRPLHCE